ncbi:response regulator [Flavobacterium muglaense]|uniref:Response regulator n=1 Tax=Flavobacterium muglaense TaxID=2764716 RepID=A0A923MXB5_9FLAO|nr:response regulator [Flavobacterium muglaense]MBC5836823.1 response regulator [Flavobacterium muglaense]MBC5843227.1 response regulator [Flavobacterium muglaense]
MQPENTEKPILLVEDNPIDLDLTMRAFTTKKISNPIQIARDGAEALQYIDKWESGAPTPIVILLDLKLPKVNGLEVLQKIKTHPVFKTIPIVILTTSAETSDLKTAYELGVNSYIVKPVSFEKFLDVVGHIDLYWRLTNKHI